MGERAFRSFVLTRGTKPVRLCVTMCEQPTFRCVFLVLAACALVLPCGVAAQERTVPDTRPPIAELVDRLDSPVFAAREQATADLLSRRDLTLENAEWLLTEPDLSPEQRLRLERVALEVFARGPRAALGIRFPPESREGVRIQEVLGEFPASEVLRAGDRITEADGLPITRQATFRAAILSHDPGEIMAMTLVRNGERLKVDVPLGSFAKLSGAASPRPGDLLAAWTLRRARQARDTPLPPAGLIMPKAWKLRGEEASPLPEPGSRAWEAIFATADAPRGLIVGGQMRETIDLSLSQLAAMDASRALTLEDLQTGGPADLAAQITLLRNRRELIRDDIDRITGLLERGNLDAAARAMMRRRLEDERQMLLVLEEQMRMLDEARRAKP